MNDIGVLNKSYRDEKVINFIESIGYEQRVDNYYCIREKDGYINVSFYKDPYIIQFHKNFYYEGFRLLRKKDIQFRFTTFQAFQKFMESYHKKECRKLKIKKIKNGFVGS